MDLETRKHVLANLKALKDDCQKLVTQPKSLGSYFGGGTSSAYALASANASDYFRVLLDDAHKKLVKAFDGPIRDIQNTLPTETSSKSFFNRKPQGYERLTDTDEDEILEPEEELFVEDDTELQPIQDKLTLAFSEFSSAILTAYNNTLERSKSKPDFENGPDSEGAKLEGIKDKLQRDLRKLEARIAKLPSEAPQQSCTQGCMNVVKQCFGM